MAIHQKAGFFSLGHLERPSQVAFTDRSRIGESSYTQLDIESMVMFVYGHYVSYRIVCLLWRANEPVKKLKGGNRKSCRFLNGWGVTPFKK